MHGALRVLVVLSLLASTLGCRKRTFTPHSKPAPPGVAAVAVERKRTCVVVHGHVECVGSAEWDGANESPIRVWVEPHVVPGTEGATDVALGMNFGCALLANRTVRCRSLRAGPTRARAWPRAR